MKKVFLCSICNVTSGSCEEDCGFCTQSVHHGADVAVYKEKEIEKILGEIKVAKNYGALGFCLVTSGKSLDTKKLEYISKCAVEIKKIYDDLHLIACCGVADRESLLELKKSGIDSYNHNLETSRKFYEKICTTHDWEERYKTCENVKDIGLMLCSGGIFGMGEGFDDRIEYLRALAALNPETTPINFYIKNSSLPIQSDKISKNEAIECIRLVREHLMRSRIMIAGGRDVVFGDGQKEIFEAGVDAIVLGDYLTVKGRDRQKDLDMLHTYGLEVATSCHE